MSAPNWSSWSKSNILENQFVTQGVDFIELMSNMSSPNPPKDYAVSIEMAKHIAMMAKTQRAHDQITAIITAQIIVIALPHFSTHKTQHCGAFHEDYISLTDMVQNFDDGSKLIESWLRNKDTIEFLGVWERLNNLSFNSLEFEGIRIEAGLNRFTMSAKKWKSKNPDKVGNIRDYATVNGVNVAIENVTNNVTTYCRNGG